MKAFRGILFGVLFSLPVWGLVLLYPEPAPEVRSQWETALIATVSVRDSHGGYGSGFVVRSEPTIAGRPDLGFTSQVMTCAHVVDGEQEMFVGDVPVTQVLRLDQGLDVAIVIIITPRRLATLEIASEDPPIGAELATAGFPLTGPDRMWMGRGTWTESERMVGMAGPGSSGSPVLYQGKVVGMIRGVWGAPPGFQSSLTQMASWRALRQIL